MAAYDGVEEGFCPVFSSAPLILSWLPGNLRKPWGRPGVYFFSLDCNQPVAVGLARRFFHLAYEHARMSARRLADGGIAYSSQRRGDAVVAEYEWRGAGEWRVAEPGSLEFFLLERYALFTARPDGTLVWGRVHHEPYRIRDGEVAKWSARPVELAGFSLHGPPASALVSAGVDVSVFPVRPVESGGPGLGG